MDLSEREDQTSDPDEEDVECRFQKVSKKIANVTLESDSLPESPQTAEERTVRRKKRTKRKGQQMDVDPTPRAKAESKYMDCDGFESHISSSDESYSEDNKGREADDEQSDWVGDTTPTRSPFETPFDRRVHIRRSQPNVHQTSSMQKKIEKFAREGGRGELVLETRFRDRASSSLLQRYLYKYHLEVVRRHRGSITLRKKFESPGTANAR
uniref:Protein 33K n=1 Tax=Caenorhabditis tropicalis TaxID=1561998 RepID=A0A1I7U7T0_9PELO